MSAMLKHLLRTRRAAWSSTTEDGSIVMALLAAIVVGGLITVVFATTITGQRSVRFDQRFTGAVHVAEAGVQEVVHRLNTGQIVPSDDHDPDNPVEEAGSGTIDGEPYTWTATQISNHEWEVVSSSASDGINRTVQAIISDQPVYPLAAFSDVFWQSHGNNQADSYHSEALTWCTGQGRVGSNDEIQFDGVSLANDWCQHAYPRDKQTVDGVDLYDWEAAPDPLRCNHDGGGQNCYEDNDPTKEWYLETPDRRIDFDEQLEWMDEVLELCGDDLAPVKGSDWSGSIPPAQAGGTNPKTVQDPDPDNDGYIYCAQTLWFDVHTTLAGADPDDPVVFVVEQRVRFDRASGNRLRVNCDGCTGNSLDPTDPAVYPKAGALQIFTPATDAGAELADAVVHLSGQPRVSGLILAPNGTCTGGAQAHIFGTLICSQVANEGGWNFHYDEALLDQFRTGEYSVFRWAEL